MTKKTDVLIIGGGIIGCSIAWYLSKYNTKTLLVEKNPVFADETTRGNSGVIHCGFDAESHKIEASLNVKGNQIWKEEIFPHFKFSRAKVDSLVIAFNKEEEEHIEMLYKRGLTNKVPPEKMKIISQKELLQKEPNINPAASKALLCTNSYAIDPVQASLEFLEKAEKNGVEKLSNAEVTNIKFDGTKFTVFLKNKEIIETKYIINAAGHYADVMAEIAGYPDFKQTTKRGQYRILERNLKINVNNICFKVPTLHGKGVIVAPMLDGHTLVGPTAEDGVLKEETRLVTQEKYECIGKIGKEIIPNLEIEKTMMTLAGSRPIDIKTNDFVIGPAKENKQFINAAGMQSPGLSAAPAIAELIIEHLKITGLKLEK
ncbi:type 2 glycerol-3-phosphate oxidase [Mycoplasma iguanae]|uniref:Type 2 glycerol-3-phosphate oxidase n=1 Tax=Mycoplasma iguanae TaxID=292461 RepID=A0ABY5R820_9MOLU|nr:type 2 glycerol-3-phosphate oxidase [Mycoplasma iguanae]UVD81634.1 type 2 glycerol-3-phosphate oxidase [Mycoplasma iguanae]